MLRIAGVLAVTYHTDQDLFNLETIFAAVFAAGKKMGQEYLPEVAPSPPES
ncbi:MAG: hypothetical protein HY790_01675 [Deltaproteobacteria bacterium]|nr:hypothetical protein [Deltaproteobacteria bacterium]